MLRVPEWNPLAIRNHTVVCCCLEFATVRRDGSFLVSSTCPKNDQRVQWLHIPGTGVWLQFVPIKFKFRMRENMGTLLEEAIIQNMWVMQVTIQLQSSLLIIPFCLPQIFSSLLQSSHELPCLVDLDLSRYRDLLQLPFYKRLWTRVRPDREVSALQSGCNFFNVWATVFSLEGHLALHRVHVMNICVKPCQTWENVVTQKVQDLVRKMLSPAWLT